MTILFASIAPNSMGDNALKEIAGAATAFVGSLSAEQKAAAVLPFNSDERLNWHYVPKVRQGVSLKVLNPEQRELAFQILKTALSQEGFTKIETIRSLEEVLHELEGGRGSVRDLELYYFALFGEPSETGNWGLRYEGHHLSLHWTIVDGKIVSTLPQFMGSNPGEVRSGPKQGTRALADEEDIGRKLVKALDEKQLAECVQNVAVPPDIITGASREAAIEDNVGLSYAAMNADQQGILISLIQVLANVQRPELAEARLNRLREAGLDAIKFAWIGGFERGEKHYYRIQGPTFVIEYDNTQNDANHVHVVWRDFKGDFGMDALKAHYATHADSKHPQEHKH
ncbi:MAG TPA: DUF3500 domain-containing protein [Candidatus Hydrogenedentes bacterium]|nr:DUF3500 domain-containing protein [Candidatus Hydrogenedentota bacterium]